MRTTKTLQQKRQEASRRTAVTTQEWRQLCRAALEAATEAKDRRAEGLKMALEQGREQQTLQTFGIVCHNDVLREFSKSRTSSS